MTHRLRALRRPGRLWPEPGHSTKTRVAVLGMHPEAWKPAKAMAATAVALVAGMTSEGMPAVAPRMRQPPRGMGLPGPTTEMPEAAARPGLAVGAGWPLEAAERAGGRQQRWRWRWQREEEEKPAAVREGGGWRWRRREGVARAARRPARSQRAGRRGVGTMGAARAAPRQGRPLQGRESGREEVVGALGCLPQDDCDEARAARPDCVQGDL